MKLSLHHSSAFLCPFCQSLSSLLQVYDLSINPSSDVTSHWCCFQKGNLFRIDCSQVSTLSLASVGLKNCVITAVIRLNDIHNESICPNLFHYPTVLIQWSSMDVGNTYKTKINMFSMNLCPWRLIRNKHVTSLLSTTTVLLLGWFWKCCHMIVGKGNSKSEITKHKWKNEQANEKPVILVFQMTKLSHIQSSCHS